MMSVNAFTYLVAAEELTTLFPSLLKASLSKQNVEDLSMEDSGKG